MFLSFCIAFFRKNVELHCYSFVIKVIDACHQSTGTRYRTRESKSFSIEQERAAVDIFFAFGFVICKCSGRICK